MEYKDYTILKLTINYSKTAVLSLKTTGGARIAKAGGYGYDKVGTVFKKLFEKLGFDVANICYPKFDLFDYPIEEANKFLASNGINYRVNYRANINNRIDFIELEKLLVNKQ
jgi:hypothetical protein